MIVVMAAVMGLVAVGCGAFGAHGLSGRLDAQELGWWTTASHYLLAHAAAVLGCGLSGRRGAVRVGALVMGGGALVFAITLYAMALGAPRALGAVTPIGGLGMLAGWATLGVGAARRR